MTAAMGLVMFSAGSSAASAQAVASPLGTAAHTMKSAVSTVRAITTSAVATVTGSVIQTAPASSVSLTLQRPIAREAAWLQQGGWSLYALVDRFSAGAPLDEQANCIAVAVYHEARGESLEGQLAVARVIMNRAASGQYPTTWCGVVKQPWQFSFVRKATCRQSMRTPRRGATLSESLGSRIIMPCKAYPRTASGIRQLCLGVLGPPPYRVTKSGAHFFRPNSKISGGEPGLKRGRVFFPGRA